MDFLDPVKTRRNNIMLLIGYVLVGIVIAIIVTILYFVAQGFGLGKNHEVIQNGLVFVSSTPRGSQILLDGTLNKSKTNTRLILPADTYNVSIRRNGYHTWKRSITASGGSVVRYDYPFLFPLKLESKTKLSYDSAPVFASQSPDRRWLVVQQTADSSSISVQDLNAPKQAPVSLALPPSLLGAGDNQSWQVIEWADDNTHLLLKHGFDSSFEYILLNRDQPAESVNLTSQLAINPTELRLFDKKYDSYVAYSSEDKQVVRVTLKNSQPQPYLSNTYAFHTYSDDTVLYVSDENAPAGKVVVRLRQNDKTYDLKTLPKTDTTYLVNLTKYSNDWYVAFGVASDNKVYVYRDPVQQLTADKPALLPAAILKVTNPNYLAFSTSAQYVVAENGQNFSVYDAELKNNYTYTIADKPFDGGQIHATWMDGNRLTYVSNGSLIVFDYDKANLQTLAAASPSYTPFFDQSYRNLYTLSPAKADPAKVDLLATPLRITADQ